MAPPETAVRPQLFVKPTYGPVLCDVAMRVKVRASQPGVSGEVTMPVPSDYSGQCVVGFRVQVQPESALVGWHWRRRSDGLNRVVEIQLKPGSADATVSYSARMLVPGFYVLQTQRRDFENWLGATVAVPADDPKIRETAARLKEKNQDLEAFVGKAVKWAAQVPLDSAVPKQEPLRRAELCAAVLRASKIPARLVAVVPKLLNRMEVALWRVEYRSDVRNWEQVDPYVGIQYPVRNSAAVLMIASRMDETHGPNLSAAEPSAPSLSNPEISSELRWAEDEARTPLTEMTVLREFPSSSRSRLMPAAKRRSLKIDVAALKGETLWIDDATLRRVIAKGPTNLALYLDERPTLPDRRRTP